MKKLRDLEQVNTDAAVEINMSPLIDMVFLLLIFFMVTSVFVQRSSIEVERPSAASATTKEGKKINFTIDSNGLVFYDNEEVDLLQVQAITSRQLAKADASVVVIADTTSQTGMLIKVIDNCKIAGAKEVSIAADNN